jgi:hypothetical protein
MAHIGTLPEPSLSALDPNLSLLAAQAAIELDCLVREEETDLASAKRLAILLSNSIKRSAGQQGSKPLVDPTTLTLMSRAFDASNWGKQIQTVDDLIVEACRVAADLQSPEKSEDRKMLESIRAFCAALAEGAASYIQLIHCQRPTHPYRR